MIRNERAVLCVDDNCKALRLLPSVLSGFGYKVVTACDARQALERMEHGSFDLILLGYRLPRTTDFKLLEINRLSPRYSNHCGVWLQSFGAGGIALCERLRGRGYDSR